MQTKNHGDLQTKFEAQSGSKQLEDPVTALILEDDLQRQIQMVGDWVRWMQADDELLFYGTSLKGAVQISQSREIVAPEGHITYVEFSKRLESLSGDGINEVILCFRWSGMVEKIAGPEDRVATERLIHFSKNLSGQYEEEGYCGSRIFASTTEELTLVGLIFGASLEKPKTLVNRIAQHKLVFAVNGRPNVRVHLPPLPLPL